MEGGPHSDQPGAPPSLPLPEGRWQLGLGEATSSYPERAGEPDCIYYLRTGFCGYGDRCRFNHPRDRSSSPVARGGRVGGGDYPERSVQPICQYFLRTGSCKFGSSCKYHHTRQGGGSVSSYSLNIYGYPMRPGEKECSYYMKTGQCKFGMTCKFHHPQPGNVPVPASTPAAVPPAPITASTVYPSPLPVPQPYGVVAGNWPVVRPSMVQGSYMQGPYGPILLSPGIVPLPGWAPYPAPNPMTNPNTPSAVGAGQLYGLNQLSPLAPAYTGAYQAISSAVDPSSSISKEHSFPQRPGQPECQYYLKTGDCKYGSSCKYHHPVDWVVPELSSALSPMGLPLRPGTPICSYYTQHGVCKYGPACKFDHPMGTVSYCPSASSLSDMSDLRAEGIAGSNKDSGPTLPSTASISNVSGGSVSSKSGSISQSGVEQSSQSAAVSGASTERTVQGGAQS